MELEQVKQELEQHIERCGFDDDLVVNYLDDDDEGKGVLSDLRIADDHWLTVDLNIEKTLVLLRLLPEDCTYEEFLDCIIDRMD
jgi:hypothetical protein